MGLCTDVLGVVFADSDGTRVFVERMTHFETQAGPFALPVLAIFEVDAAGKITGWRDYFDRKQAGLD